MASADVQDGIVTGEPAPVSPATAKKKVKSKRKMTMLESTDKNADYLKLKAEHEKLLKRYAKLETNYKGLKREYNKLVDFYGAETKRQKSKKRKTNKEGESMSTSTDGSDLSASTDGMEEEGISEGNKRFSLSNPSQEFPEYSEEQVRIAKHAFSKYDWDKSGSIDRAEVILLLQDLKQGGYMQMSDALFRRYVDMNWRKIDTDDTGEVTFEEFLLFIFKSSDILNSQVTKGIQDRVRASVTFQKNLQEELEKMGLDREY